MNAADTIRAWKDPEYRATLDQAPDHPAGTIELTDDELEHVAGGGYTSSRFRNTGRPKSHKPKPKPEPEPTPTPRWRTPNRNAPSWNS